MKIADKISHMKRVCFVVLFAVMIPSSFLHADDTSDKGSKKFGFVYNIASDRQLEKIGGIYEPEGIDKYVKRRFDELNDRTQAIETKLNVIEEHLKVVQASIDKLGQVASDEQQTSEKP